MISSLSANRTQGGGWCPNAEDCAARAGSYLGSSAAGCKGCSNTSTQDMELMVGCEGSRWCGPLISESAAVNPVAHDWNTVFIRYCDGASFIGSVDAPLKHGNQQLFFRGKYNLHGVFADLIKNHGLGNASHVIVGGDSAGGLATFFHIDRMADWIYAANTQAGRAKTQVLGMPDSGFWPDNPDLHWIGQRSFSSDFRDMYRLQAGPAPAMPKHCKWNTTDHAKCLHPQYFADEIETRLFVVQPLYDPLQSGNPEGLTPDEALPSPDDHASWIRNTIQSLVIDKVPPPGQGPNGAWIYSCARHCGGQTITIDGDSVTSLLPGFLAAADPRTTWIQDSPYPCQGCCNDGHTYPPFYYSASESPGTKTRE